MLNGNREFWKDYKLKNNLSSKKLADIALRILSTPASEASCERVFSRMKYIVGNRRY
jgi:hypothetical protein